MSEEKESRRARAKQWWVILGPLVAVWGCIGTWLVPASVAYVVYAQVRVWVSEVAGLALLLVVGIAGVALSGVGGLLVFKFWPQLVRLFKWLTAPLRSLYVWLLWHLVIRPARDHRGLVVAARDEYDQFDGMSTHALRILVVAAEGYLSGKHATGDGTVLLEPSDSWGGNHQYATPEQIRRVGQKACDELLGKGLVTRATLAPGEADYDPPIIEVTLPPWCTMAGGARPVLRRAKLELNRRDEAEWEAGHGWPTGR
jgi:hypothetical protein